MSVTQSKECTMKSQLIGLVILYIIDSTKATSQHKYMQAQIIRDMESSVLMEPVKDCEGHLDIKAESDSWSLYSHPDEHVEKQVMADYSLKEGIR